MTRARGGAARGDGPWFAVLVACLLLSLALYVGLAVTLASVPPGWNGPVGFSLESAPLFRAFNHVPALALSRSGFERAMAALLVGLWGCWGTSLIALRRIAQPELRRWAGAVVIGGMAAMLLLVVVCAPPLLSMDLYRQAAYGRMVAHHHLNPYATAVNAIAGDPLFAFANHRHLTTHYGPAYTLLSALAAWLAPSHPLGAALAWKTMSACAAAGCALLVAPVARALATEPTDGRDSQLWLAWNPLLIIESAVSAHLEPIMIAAALAGLLLWLRERATPGAITLVISTLTKWLTGLLLVFAVARQVHRSAPGGRLRTFLALSAAVAVATAVLYAPFADGMRARGGISDLALRGSATVGSGAGGSVPQWALLGAFALLVLGTMRFVARGDWRRLVATTSALTLVFVALVNPWPFPWYFLTPVALAAPLPRGRAGFVLRTLTAGVGALTLLMYVKLVPWP